MSNDQTKPLDQLLSSAQTNIAGTAMANATKQALSGFAAPGSLDAVAQATGQLVCECCHALNAPLANFCRNCGSPLVQVSKCKACQTTVRIGDRFCSQCGKEIV